MTAETLSGGPSDADARPREEEASGYPPIEDHGLIADCHSAALICGDGTIDWCCLPRYDSASVFGSLLDAEHGGCWRLWVDDEVERRRRYVEDSLVLETIVETETGRARSPTCSRCARAVGGTRVGSWSASSRGSRARCGSVPGSTLGSTTARRSRGFASTPTGSVPPSAARTGARDLVGRRAADRGEHDLVGELPVAAGERHAVSLRFRPPEEIPYQDGRTPEGSSLTEVERHRRETIDWWAGWSSQARLEERFGPAAVRSAIVLKALIHAPTGAMVAVPRTSLPETPGGRRNWDYRYSWIRDSSFAVRALDELGLGDEAEGFRRFVERSAAGSVHELQIMYGVGGERFLPDLTLDHLEG